MTFSGFAFLWFALALGCMLAGMVLTGKRLEKTRPSARVVHRTMRRQAPARVQDGSLCCTRCGQSLEAGARFCGACGLAVLDRRRNHSERERLTRQA